MLLAIVTIVAALVGIAAWRSGIIRKKLLVTIASRSRLFLAPESVREEIKLLYGERALENPYVTVVEILNVGKSHIRSEDFDKQRDLVFESNVPVIKVLATEYKPSSAPTPKVIADEDKISLEPELINKDELIASSLLTEGRLEELKVVLKPFGDVGIEVIDREAQTRRRSRRMNVVLTATIVAALGGSALVGVLASRAITRSSVSLPACSFLFQDQLATSSSIQETVLNFKLSQIPGKEAGTFSFDYKQSAADATMQAEFLMLGYQIDKESGVSLGSAASVAPKVSQAEKILGKLENNAATSISKSELNELSTTADLIASNRASPSECQ